jgi:hypothetical protein
MNTQPAVVPPRSELPSAPATLADLKSHPYHAVAALMSKKCVISTMDIMDGNTFHLLVTVHRNLTPGEKTLFNPHLPEQGEYVFVDMSREKSPSCIKRYVLCANSDSVLAVDYIRDSAVDVESRHATTYTVAEFMQSLAVVKSLAELSK